MLGPPTSTAHVFGPSMLGSPTSTAHVFGPSMLGPYLPVR